MNRRQVFRGWTGLGALLGSLGWGRANAADVCPPPQPVLAGGTMVTRFESNGPGTSERFELEDGLAIIHVRSALNDERCEVLLYWAPPDKPLSGQTPQTIFDGYFGPAGDRTWATTVIAGTYVVTVSGLGDWAVSVEQ